MNKELSIKYSYRMEGHFTISGDDTGFYSSLPNTQENYLNTQSGRREIPGPDMGQLITVLGSAVLSSTVLANAIKACLEYRKTKISISIEGAKKTLTFEGPNLKKSQAEIEKLIESLSDEAGTGRMTIRAERAEH